MPKDIFPCTVDDANWTAKSSMSFLFGQLYTQAPIFRHDQVMLAMLEDRRQRSKRQRSNSTDIEDDDDGVDDGDEEGGDKAMEEAIRSSSVVNGAGVLTHLDAARRRAWGAEAAEAARNGTWADLGSLVCVHGHQRREEEI